MPNGSAKGVVAAGHRLTAQAGVDILREGGTAIDAAIAALAMSCVCEPVLCSPGGGGFAMLRDGKAGETTLIDFFAQTPLRKRARADDGVREVLVDFGTATQAFHIGPATTATPGFWYGIEHLHARGGTIGLPDLVSSACRAAREGLEITPFQHFLSTVVGPILTASEDARKLFAPDGNLQEAGETFRNPGLADALETLANEGLLKSAVGAEMVREQDGHGHLSQADFEAYASIVRSPLSVSAADAGIRLNPLPAASGPLIAHSLKHLESSDPVDIARALLATGQARREANGDLAALRDMPLRQRGTTHLSVIDAAGNACAVTVSNGEGNGDIVGEFGFMLNNILGEEDVNPAGTDDWPENTRLSSMMCPTVIEKADGSIVAMGSGGSNRIRSAILQTVIQICMNDEDLEHAITAPRLHLEGEHVDFEDFFAPEVRSELCALFPDHRAWPERNLFFGGVHAAMLTADGTFIGQGDTRRDGIALIAD